MMRNLLRRLLGVTEVSIIQKRERPQDITCPPWQENHLRWLQATFPNRLPAQALSAYDLGRLQGQQDVVEAVITKAISIRKKELRK